MAIPLFSNKMTSLIRMMGEALLFSAMITHCCSLLWYWNDLQVMGALITKEDTNECVSCWTPELRMVTSGRFCHCVCAVQS